MFKRISVVDTTAMIHLRDSGKEYGDFEARTASVNCDDETDPLCKFMDGGGPPSSVEPPLDTDSDDTPPMSTPSAPLAFRRVQLARSLGDGGYDALDDKDQTAFNHAVEAALDQKRGWAPVAFVEAELRRTHKWDKISHDDLKTALKAAGFKVSEKSIVSRK